MKFTFWTVQIIQTNEKFVLNDGMYWTEIYYEK